jgi:hypothetical protein
MRTLLAMLAVFFTAPAWAEWVVITKTANGTVFYIDPQSIQRDGDLRRISTLMNLQEKNQEGKQSARALEEYDCKAAQNRVLSHSDHSEPFAAGETLSSKDAPTPWKSLTPRTIGQAILLLVCNMSFEKGVPAENGRKAEQGVTADNAVATEPVPPAVAVPPVKPAEDDWWRYEGRRSGGR